ncbi:MAG: hypothetical protein AAGB24_06110, partial [Bacteroidota bacterium]
MKVGERISKNSRAFSEDDLGISVSKALDLVKESPFYNDLYENLRISEVKKEFIPIVGAKSLVDTV